jgi:hypothetical protein
LVRDPPAFDTGPGAGLNETAGETAWQPTDSE